MVARVLLLLAFTALLPAQQGTISDADLARVRRALPPPELAPLAVTRSFDIRGDSRALIEQVLKAYGLEVVFDGDYQPIQNLQFRLADAGADEALEAVQAATASFLVPVGRSVALAVRETPQKRQDLEPVMELLVPLPGVVSAQEAQEAARLAQQLLELRRFSVDTRLNMALLSDTVAKVKTASLLYDQILRHRAEVLIEVEFIELAGSFNRRLGLRPPASFPVTWLKGAVPLSSLAAGTSLFGIGIADSTLLASFAESSGRTLMRAELRSAAGQEASLHVGDRYPIVTTRYVALEPDAFVPPPGVNFEQLGLLLKVTPTVHGPDEVTLAVDARVETLTGQSLNGIPVVAARQFINQVRVREGEWVVLAGLVRSSESQRSSGPAGLARIPVLGWLFRNQSVTRDSGSTLLVIKPRVLSLPASELLVRDMRAGSATRPKPPL